MKRPHRAPSRTRDVGRQVVFVSDAAREDAAGAAGIVDAFQSLAVVGELLNCVRLGRVFHARQLGLDGDQLLEDRLAGRGVREVWRDGGAQRCLGVRAGRGRRRSESLTQQRGTGQTQQRDAMQRRTSDIVQQTRRTTEQPAMHSIAGPPNLIFSHRLASCVAGSAQPSARLPLGDDGGVRYEGKQVLSASLGRQTFAPTPHSNLGRRCARLSQLRATGL